MAQPGSSSDAPAAAAGSSASASLSSVLPWLRSVGIWWDADLLDIRAGCSGTSGPDLGVFAVTDIKENQLLCVIPRSAILSPRTTRLAALLEQERLGGGLALVIAVMYEASLGQHSKWAGYFASLPLREYLPIFWTDAELDLLQGTSLHGRTVGDRQDIQDDYETHVVPLMQKHPEAFPQPGRCSLDDFRVAASWVSSRCFFVDSWHGDAMVPLADIFNHKASVVLLGDAWGVAELADPRHEHEHEHEHGHEHGHGHDGSGDDSHEHEHDSSEDEAAAEEEEEGTGEEEGEEGEEGDSEADGSDSPQHEFPVGGMPLIAPGQAAAAAAAAAKGSSSDETGRWGYDGINLRLEIGICSMGPADSRELPPAPMTTAAAAAAIEDAADGSNGAVGPEEQPAKKKRKVQQQQQQQQQQVGGQHNEGQQQQQWPEKRLEIVAASAVPARAEVHNTYGELGNAQLVAKYGFCLPRNPFDEVTLCDTWSGFISGSSEGSAAAGFKAPARLKQHVKWLQKNSNVVDDVAEDEEAPDPPQITPGGRLDMMTAAVVRLLGASTAQLQEWQGLEDVLLLPQDNSSSDNDADDPPAAVPLHAAAAPTAAAGKTAGEAAGEAAAGGGAEQGGDQTVAQHFEAVAIGAHDLAWWGRAGLELLAAAVRRRLARYPASLAADRLALQQQQQQQKAGSRNSSGAAADAEHATAVTAALQLRVCEQEALQEVLDAVQQVLGAL